MLPERKGQFQRKRWQCVANICDSHQAGGDFFRTCVHHNPCRIVEQSKKKEGEQQPLTLVHVLVCSKLCIHVATVIPFRRFMEMLVCVRLPKHLRVFSCRTLRTRIVLRVRQNIFEHYDTVPRATRVVAHV